MDAVEMDVSPKVDGDEKGSNVLSRYVVGYKPGSGGSKMYGGQEIGWMVRQ